MKDDFGSIASTILLATAMKAQLAVAGIQDHPEFVAEIFTLRRNRREATEATEKSSTLGERQEQAVFSRSMGNGK